MIQRRGRTDVGVATTGVLLLEMKFAFYQRGNINANFGVVCFLDPNLQANESQNHRLLCYVIYLFIYKFTKGR